jgi:hypothetical protein
MIYGVQQPRRGISVDRVCCFQLAFEEFLAASLAASIWNFRLSVWLRATTKPSR